MAISGGSLTIHQFGNEREPVVQIDDYSGMVAELRAAACDVEYQSGGGAYPGLRAWARPDYLDRKRALMMEVMSKIFGFSKTLTLDASTYSLVTMSPEELSPFQRIPHYDHAEGKLVAVMHYLLGAETGGTAFYRHKRTGFETITPQREQTFHAARLQDEKEFGVPPAAYFYGDDDRYELIGEIEAKPDRLVLYRGRMLHSGVIPDPSLLTDDPATGRLTINMFLRGQ